MNNLKIDILSETDAVVFFVGSVTKESILHNSDEKITTINVKNIIFDFSKCEEIDSAGAVEILRLKYLLLKNSKNIEIIKTNTEHEKLLTLYEKHFHPLLRHPDKKTTFVEMVGKNITLTFRESLNFLGFLGELVSSFVKLLFSPRKFRFVAFTRQIQSVVLGAVPIVMVLSFLIGLVIAYQATGYLVKINGVSFIVEISTMSVFRELSVMITAIMVAARSASAFTAEIGSMKITQEIDAMRTMGFDPFVFLVIPRVLALTLFIPLLVFCADMAGLLGAFVVARFHAGIGYSEFVSLLYHDVSIMELYVGLGKSPLYGAIVAIVGCYMGFRVDNSTESIGRMTTKSVVFAIFWVIIADCCIAVALTKLGI